MLVIWQPANTAHASSLYDGEAPAGFQQILAAAGVRLYRKDYAGGSPDFVQIVDLSSGAEVRLLSGEVTELRSGKGAYGGNDARFRSKTVEAFYETFKSKEKQLFCSTNGSFFYMPEYPTRLPFPLKSGGQILSDGYAANQFEGKKLILELWPGYADIRLLTAEALYQSTAPDILGGLAEDANKRATHYTGRTFVGVQDRNADGLSETVLIFSSRTASQAHAAVTLRSFGAQKIMMLDGGGSTQLVCNGRVLVASERLVPQALAILAGDPAGKASQTIVQGQLPTPVLPASSIIAASPPPTSVPFNPDEDRPAVILPGASGSASVPSGINEPVDAPAEEAISASLPFETEDNPATIPQVSTASIQPASLSQISGQPLYDLADILIIPLFMLPVIIIIFAILIRRQFERYSP